MSILRHVVLVAVVVGCGSSNELQADAASDATAQDTSRSDVPIIDSRVDATNLVDARVDVGLMDARVSDGATIDSATDSLVGDATTRDTTVADSAVCTDFTEPGVVAGMPPPASACNVCRPASGTIATSGSCSTDADCTAGHNGRCLGSRIGFSCSYDECFAHSDCANGEVCACGGDSIATNRCLPANCRSNDDCGGRVCAPTFGSCGTYLGFIAYRCHTQTDACAVDSDCGGGGAYCAFNATENRWLCSTLQCAG